MALNYKPLALPMALLAASLLPAELNSVIFACIVIAVLLFRGRVDRSLLVLVWPFFTLLLIGIVQSVFREFGYGVLRDAWYVAKVPFSLALGYLLVKQKFDWGDLSRSVTLVSAIVSGIYLSQVLIAVVQGENILQLRRMEGLSPSLIVCVGVAIAFSLKCQRHWSAIVQRFAVILLPSLAILMSFSRTYIVVSVLMIIAMKGWVRVSLKSFIRASLLTGLAAGLVVSIAATLPGVKENVFFDKWLGSISEITLSEYATQADINRNWRGFEAGRALEDYREGSVGELIFGQGLGATVDLKEYITLGGAERRYLPRIHNGYIFILLKTGVVGFFIYIAFLVRLVCVGIRYSGSNYQNQFLLGRLMVALSVCLVATTLVISGPFNKSELTGVCLLVGAVTALLGSGGEMLTRRVAVEGSMVNERFQ